jgi:hypothetical protein
LATSATTGAPPVPVPPPSPQVTKTMSAPLRTSTISSRWSSAACADARVGAGTETARQVASDVELHVGVGHQQGLGVGVDRDELDTAEPASIIRFTALTPPPPTPTTLITAR